MKSLFVIFFTVLAFAVGSDLFAQKNATAAPVLIKTKDGVNDISVKVSYQPSPILKFDGYSSRAAKSKSTKNETRWLEVECKFMTTPPPVAKNGENVDPYLDEITVKYDVILYETRSPRGASSSAKRGAAAKKSVNPPVIFSGQESYVNIMRDDDEHAVVAFISPSYLNAYLSPSIIGKKAEDFFAVLVSVYYKDKIVASGCYVPKGYKKEITAGIKGNDVEKKGMFREVKKLTEHQSTYKALEAVRRRNTPYEYVNFDIYEQLKPLPQEKTVSSQAAPEPEAEAPAPKEN